MGLEAGKVWYGILPRFAISPRTEFHMNIYLWIVDPHATIAPTVHLSHNCGEICDRNCDRNCDANFGPDQIGSTSELDPLSLCMYMHRSTLVYIYMYIYMCIYMYPRKEVHPPFLQVHIEFSGWCGGFFQLASHEHGQAHLEAEKIKI